MLDRRSVIRNVGALPIALALSSASAGAGPSRRPPRLRLGDTVGLVEPAGFSDNQAQIEAAKSIITGMGLVPKVGDHVGARHGYLAGTDQQRAGDLNEMFVDDEVQAVFAVRGGWGSPRLLPFLDWDAIRANPKLLIGFSDITALHLAFAARAGYPTIHAPNASSSWPEISWNSLWRLAFTGETPVLGNPDSWNIDPLKHERWRTVAIRSGKARGPLLGGNLSVLTTLVGTPWLPTFDGAILFLEDTNEAEYRVDRMISQLALSGILGKVAGVVVGQCTHCTTGSEDYTGFTIPEILQDYLRPLNVPAFRGANIGHIGNQLSIPVGVQAEIDADLGTIRILEPVVS